MPKGNSGIKRGGKKQASKKEETFAWPGLGKMSSEALRAILGASVGTKIQVNVIGFGSYGTSEYEITLHGMSKKMLSYRHKHGDGYHKPLVLSKANIKKKLSSAELTLIYPNV